MTEKIEIFFEAIEYVLSSKNKRHIAGGILLSMSLLFAGLAITTVTIKTEEENDGR